MRGPIVSNLNYKLLTVTPTVQATPDYAAGDVLFAPTEITGFFQDRDSSAQIVSVCIIDKQIISKHAFTIYFTQSTTALGSINASADAVIGVLEEIQASIPVRSADWIAGGGAGSVDNANICTLTDPAIDGIGSVVSSHDWARNSFGTSIQIVGIANETMNVASTSDLIFKIGIKY